MNNTYSRHENYLPRWITPRLEEALGDSPVLVLTGARQVGKSTLLLNEPLFQGWRFLSMDDFDVLRQANEDPEALWAGTDRIILDEVQKAPKLLSAVKQSVDRSPGRMKFVLSGSANLLLMKQVILEYGRKVLAIEVKQTTRPGYGDMHGLKAFLMDHPDAVGGLLHSGKEIRWLGERILAVPWPMMTG